MQNLQTYQLYINVAQHITVKIGRLGTFNFPAGLYIYTGSAKRGMESRLARHLAKDKKLHWHIDYLLNNPDTSIINIKKFSNAECQINLETDGDILVPGFGASDCRVNCGSHLKYLNTASRHTNDIDF